MKKILNLVLGALLFSGTSLQVSACGPNNFKKDPDLEIHINTAEEEQALKNGLIDFLYNLPIKYQPQVDRSNYHSNGGWTKVFSSDLKTLHNKIQVQLPDVPRVTEYGDVFIKKTEIKGYYVPDDGGHYHKHNPGINNTGKER